MAACNRKFEAKILQSICILELSDTDDELIITDFQIGSVNKLCVLVTES